MFYRKGNINNYRATFYIGNKPNNILPKAYLEDVISAKRPIIWIDRNLKKIGKGAYKARFERTYRIRYIDFLGPTNPYRTVKYGGKSFSRVQYAITKVRALNSKRAKSRSRVYSGSSSIPHIINSGNFWYVAENPMDLWYEDQAYIVFTELLHDMVRIRHTYSKRALVRIEDVDAEDDPAKLKAIADYLYSQNIPFSVGVIARFYDPLGATGPPRTVNLYDKPELVQALQYMISKGGTLIMHGFTHQYGVQANPFNGVTGYDYEFSLNKNINLTSVLHPRNVIPVPEDSTQWVQSRINLARTIFNTAGLPQPQIWETPHYSASSLDYQVFAANFIKSYERTPNAYFPYLIHKSVYGRKIIPENLGYVEPGIISPSTILSRADKNLVVRDGFASFFFHPRLDISYLKILVQGIRAKGYWFVNANSL